MQECLLHNPPSFINIPDNIVFSLDPELCLSVWDWIMIDEGFKLCEIIRFTKDKHQPIEVQYLGEKLKPQLSDIISKQGLYFSGKKARLEYFTLKNNF
jgi:hypothetical protein